MDGNWREEHDLNVNFCVWILRRQGLDASPFDRHPVVDGALRPIGLTAESWYRWLDAVVGEDVSRREQFLERFRSGAPPPPSPPPARATDLWPDDPLLARHIDELWTEYIPIGLRWKREAERKQMEQRPGRREINAQRNLWKALEPFHTRVPPLAVFYVDYPAPVMHVVPPGSMLLGDLGGDLSWGAYASTLVAGAERLATR